MMSYGSTIIQPVPSAVLYGNGQCTDGMTECLLVGLQDCFSQRTHSAKPHAPHGPRAGSRSAGWCVRSLPCVAFSFLWPRCVDCRCGELRRSRDVAACVCAHHSSSSVSLPAGRHQGLPPLARRESGDVCHCHHWLDSSMRRPRIPLLRFCVILGLIGPTKSFVVIDVGQRWRNCLFFCWDDSVSCAVALPKWHPSDRQLALPSRWRTFATLEGSRSVSALTAPIMW